ncbi:hypothetical protein [Paenarthrobacter nitroguajacolicus]
MLQPSGLLVAYLPAVVVVVGMAGEDASEETVLFQVAAIQAGDITPGLSGGSAVPATTSGGIEPPCLLTVL